MIKILFTIINIVPTVLMIAFSFLFNRAIGRNYKKSFGMRTAISKQSQKAWDYENAALYRRLRMGGFLSGIIAIVMSVLCIIFISSIDVLTLLLTLWIIIEVIAAFSVIALTEYETYKYFNIISKKEVVEQEEIQEETENGEEESES